MEEEELSLVSNEKESLYQLPGSPPGLQESRDPASQGRKKGEWTRMGRGN